jgi:hypothetical protein
MSAIIKPTTPQMTGSQFFDTVLQMDRSDPYQQQVVEYNEIRTLFFQSWGLSTERYHWLQLRVAHQGTDQLNTQWCWDTSHDQMKIFFNRPKDLEDPKNKFLTMLYLKYVKSK